MIVRLLMLAGIVYLFFAVRNLFRRGGGRIHGAAGEPVDGGPVRIDDVMVQDPVCGVYVPRRTALHVRHKGNDIYFCGEACRDAFFSQHP